VALIVAVLLEWQREQLVKVAGEAGAAGPRHLVRDAARARSARSTKPFVAHLKQQWIGLLVAGTGQCHERLVVSLFQAVLQHWPVDLAQEVGADLNDLVRSDAEDARVVGGVVDLAQCEAVPHDRDTCFLRVRHDMCGVEQLAVTQGAYRASRLVGAHHGRAKDGLMQSPLGLRDDVAAKLCFDRSVRPGQIAPDLGGNGELVLLRFLGKDKDGEHWLVLGDAHPEELNHRGSLLHGGAQCAIFRVIGVVATPLVAEEAVCAHDVLVGTRRTLRTVDGADRQRR